MIKVIKEIKFLRPGGGLIDTHSLFNEMWDNVYEDIKNRISTISCKENISITIKGIVVESDQVTLSYCFSPNISKDLKDRVEKLLN